MMNKLDALAELQRLRGGLWGNRYTNPPMWGPRVE